MFEILYFRGSDKILKKKKMMKDVELTLGYIEEVLYGSVYKRELTNQALQEMGWRENGTLNILDGRRYMYKGFKKNIAIEGNFSAYEYILEGLFRLQVGFDKGKIETGILMLNSFRSEKSKLGSSLEVAKAEVEQLYPTISMSLTVALFDLGTPELPDVNSVKGGENLAFPVLPNDSETSRETVQKEYEPGH